MEAHLLVGLMQVHVRFKSFSKESLTISHTDHRINVHDSVYRKCAEAGTYACVGSHSDRILNVCLDVLHAPVITLQT